MNPVATEDHALDAPPRSIWQALRDLAISTIVVAAVALIVSFISAASAHAQGNGELRIGYQKSASQAQDALEKKPTPQALPKPIKVSDAVVTAQP